MENEAFDVPAEPLQVMVTRDKRKYLLAETFKAPGHGAWCWCKVCELDRALKNIPGGMNESQPGRSHR